MPYDPRRSRPTPKTVPDEEAAPIDALLGPSPEPEPEEATAASTDHGRVGELPAERPSPTSLPTPVRKAERAPSPVLQLAPLLIAAVVALVWLIRRRRR